MKLQDLFPSKVLSAASITGPTTAVISAVDVQTDAAGKPFATLRFAELAGGLRLSRKNAMVIAATCGDDLDAWVGCTVVLTSKVVRAFGADRLTVVVTSAAPAAAQPAKRRNGKRAAAAEEPVAEVVEPTI